MSKAVFLTHGDQPFNRSLADHLQRQGYRITASPGSHTESADRLEALRQSIAALEGLDVLIHGNEWFDEAALLDRDPDALERAVSRQLRSLFDLSRAAGMHMARRKKGQILFILVNDRWEDGLFPSSPILNHAKLAMMKTLARELSPYRIGVNAVTVGYCIPEEVQSAADGQLDLAAFRKRLDIYALKPALLPQTDYMPMIDMLLEAGDHRISGQHLQLSAGMDTPV